MNEKRKGEIALLLLKDEVRMKGIFRRSSLLAKIDHEAHVRIGISAAELNQFIFKMGEDIADEVHE